MQGEGKGIAGGRGEILNRREVREGVTEKVTSEQRLK